MPELLGQLVLTGKANMSHDCGGLIVHSFDMGQGPREATPATAYRDAFVRKTKAARIATGMSQEEMAKILDVAQDVYAKYEVRTPLPHRHITKFCLVTRIDADDLFDVKTIPTRIAQRKKSRAA